MFSIEGYLSENSTEAEVQAVVEKICNYIPAQYTELCDELIATYAPDIVEFMLRHESPQKICDSIGLCNSTVHLSPSYCVCPSEYLCGETLVHIKTVPDMCEYYKERCARVSECTPCKP